MSIGMEPAGMPGGDAATAPTGGYTFKNIEKLSAWIRWLLIADILLGLLLLGSSALEYKFLSDIRDGRYTGNPALADLATANDARQSFISLAEISAFLLSGILILVWLYRIKANLHARGALGLAFKPAWSIGCYFVPIINLWVPFQAMAENWKASEDPLNWRNLPTPALLRWWWFLWLGNSFLSNAIVRFSEQAREIDELMNANLWNDLAIVVGMALSAVFVKVVAEMTRRHNDGNLYAAF